MLTYFYQHINSIPLKQVYTILIILICGSAIQAQRTCGNEKFALKEAALHPNQVEEDMLAFKKWKKQKEEENRASIPVTIPIHIIVVHGINEVVGEGSNIDMDRIHSQLQVLNDDFARLNADASNTPNVFDAAATEISFCLATIDPMGNQTDGVTRYATNNDFQTAEDDIVESTIWPPTQYLNIYLAPELDGLLGYSSRPSPGNLPSTNNDVVRVLTSSFGGEGFATEPSYDLGRTATHEIGHWLGLRHVWGNGGCSSDDGFDDTPIQTDPNYGCPTHPSTSCSNNGDMFMNYMDYVNDNCMNSFSQEQGDYMEFIIEGTRTALINSANTACIPSGFPIVNILSIEDAICPGEASGRVELTTSSGTPPYTYSLNSGPLQSEGIFNALAAGDYTVAVTESEGMTTDIDFSIGEPLAFEFMTNIIAEACSGQTNGEISVQTSGGNSEYPELQLFNSNYSKTQKSALDENFENGFPPAWVADENWNYGNAENLSSTSFEIPMTDQFVMFNDDGLGETHVGGGSLFTSNINLNGLQNFRINFDAYFIDGDYEGADETAKVYLSDDNGVNWNEYLNLTGVEAWTSYSIDVQNWNSPNVKIRFAYDDGAGWNYGFAVDKVSVQDQLYGDFLDLAAGNYTLRATDAKGCIYDQSVVIENTEPVSFSSVDVTNVTCSSAGQVGVLATSVNGISEYQLNGSSNNTGIFSGLNAGTYTAIAIDNAGCSASQTVVVEASGSITINATQTNDISCFGGNNASLELSISGAVDPITISLNGTEVNTTTLLNLSAGDNVVEVLDANGCTESSTIFISEPAELISTAAVVDQTCSGLGQITMSTAGGFPPFTYSVNSGLNESNPVIDIAAGSYTITTTDSNGCTSQNTVNVANLATDFSITENLFSCTSDSIIDYRAVFCSSDGRVVDWYIFNNAGTELFNILAKDCVTLDLSNFLNNNPEDFFFAIEARDAGCIAELNTVAMQPNPLFDETNFVVEICGFDLSTLFIQEETVMQYDSITLSLLGNDISFSQLSDGISFPLIPDALYTLQAYDMNGCVSSYYYETIGLEKPSINILSEVDATETMLGSISYEGTGGTAPYTYQIYPSGETNDTGIFENLDPGAYELVCTDSNGCSARKEGIVDMVSSTYDIQQEIKFTLYPNPTEDFLSIKMSTEIQVNKMKIFNTNGQLIYESASINNRQVNLSNLKSGIYFVEIEAEGKFGFRRFVKI